MDGSVFYIVGGALVLAALVLSAIGIRRKESFPASKREMAGILAIFGVVVTVTAAYAVANAREEQEHRNNELAKENAEAEENVAAADKGEAPSGGPPAGAATTLDVTSPDDGLTQFDPTELDAGAGTITLAYDNPSPVPHNIAVEDEAGQTLGESEDITAGLVELSLPLTPGEYIYFCTIPGHRESGMEGTLIVQ